MKLKRYLTAIKRYTRSKGHGIHSPFAFRFVLDVLRERHPYYVYDDIAEWRKLAINNTKEFWHHPKIISLRTAKLIFRITNFFNPKAILQIGTSYGVSSACALSVSSKSKLFLCQASIEQYPVTQSILSQFNNTISQFRSFNDGLNAYCKACNEDDNPFILINDIKEEEYSEVLTYLYGISNNNGVIIIRNLMRNPALNALWDAIRNAAPTGMTFSNGKIAIIVATPKLPHQNFSLWF